MYTDNKTVYVTAVNATKKVNAATMLVNMETQRIALDTAAKRVSTTELYSLLAECLRFCNLFKDKNCDKLLVKFYAERNLKFKAKAKLTTKVIHAVFGEVDRRRVSTYAIVVNKMLRYNVTFNAVTEWITNEGGINAIKNANSNKVKTAAVSDNKSKMAVDKIKLVTDFIKREQLAVINNEKLLSALIVDEISAVSNGKVETDKHVANAKICVLIADINADGNLAVRAIIQKDTAINAALMAYYNDNKVAFETATANADVEENNVIEVDDWFYKDVLTGELTDEVVDEDATKDVVDTTADVMDDVIDDAMEIYA